MTKTKYTETHAEPRKRLSLCKKILIAFFVLILALVSTVFIAYSRYLYPTGNITADLYAIRNNRNNIPMVNFFLLQVGEKYIAIDAGSDSTQTENELRKLGISADDIIAVFVTHSHYDHIASLHLFSNATLYTGNTEFQYATIPRFSPDFFELPNIPHIIMDNGESIELYGTTIKCIYTPGHTSDSVSYLIDSKYLFVGDLLIRGVSPYNTELRLLHIENILEMDEVKYIFTGHFGLFKDIKFFRWWLG